MAGIVSKEIRMRGRAVGTPTGEHFELAEVAMPPIKDGEVLVRNIWMSVDPYMRFQMMEQNHYPGWEIGKVLDGGSVGQIVESKSDRLKVGDYVQSTLGWREYFAADPDSKGNTLVPPGKPLIWRIDPALAPLDAFIGAMGMPGLSAYAGLVRVAGLKSGETVFISGAGGAVGTVACEIAKAMGCTVIASAGTDDKCAWLRDVAGVDRTINYKKVENLKAAVKEAAPDGINVFFDNVGGEHLVAAIANMADHGRLAICGTISQYNATTKPTGPRNLNLVVPKKLRLEGFEISDHYDLEPEFQARMGQWIREGKVHNKATVFEGIANAPRAFIGLFEGENLGKMLVRLGADA